MLATPFNEEVLFTTQALTMVTAEDIDELKQKAQLTRRKRMRLCLHRDISAGVHEMLIVQPKGAYLRPHKHLGKEESFHLIEGAVAMVIFADDHSVQDVIPMGTVDSGKPFYYRMPVDVYHTVLIESEVLVYHETTSGPFRKADMILAPWAPAEDDGPAAQEFLARLQEIVEGRLASARRGGHTDG